MQALLWLWPLVAAVLLLIVHAVAMVFATAVVRAVAVRVVFAALIAWVRVYTRRLDAYEREIRRADFRRDLFWGRYRRLRRRREAGVDLVLRLAMPVIKDMPGDVAEAVSIFADERIA